MQSMWKSTAGSVLRSVASWFTPAKNEFADRYKHHMIYDVRQLGDIVPLTGDGICDALVMEWFRRIWAGRTTWRHKHGRVEGHKQVTIRKTVDWEKKRARLERLQQSNAAYGDDYRFGYTSLPLPDSAARQTRLMAISPYQTSGNYGDQIMAQLRQVRQTHSAAPHLFFALRLSLASYGHMIGLHLMRDGTEDNRSPDTKIDGHMLHLFDPNVGEFRASAGHCERILHDLLQMYGDRIQHFTLSHVHVWWGQNAGRPQENFELV